MLTLLAQKLLGLRDEEVFKAWSRECWWEPELGKWVKEPGSAASMDIVAEAKRRRGRQRERAR